MGNHLGKCLWENRGWETGKREAGKTGKSRKWVNPGNSQNGKKCNGKLGNSHKSGNPGNSRNGKKPGIPTKTGNSGKIDYFPEWEETGNSRKIGKSWETQHFPKWERRLRKLGIPVKLENLGESWQFPVWVSRVLDVLGFFSD